MDTDETAELRQSIRQYRNRLVDCSDAEAKVLLREFIAELENKLPPTLDCRIAAKWPSKAA
jgi:hypothetical protein